MCSIDPFGPLPDFDVCGCPEHTSPSSLPPYLVFYRLTLSILTQNPFFLLPPHQKVVTLETLEKLLIMPKPFWLLHSPPPLTDHLSSGTCRCKHIKLITSDSEKYYLRLKRYEGDRRVWFKPLNDIEVAGN